ncbi:hypothetical protein EST38_g6173, partial [Candolleomyces aberdarensis]
PAQSVVSIAPSPAQSAVSIAPSPAQSVISFSPSLAHSPLSIPPPLQNHPKYFFDDELVIFKVEGTLFRVHKHFLNKESEAFQSMFFHPPDAAGPDGRSADRPIVLPDVKVLEFEALLDVFYESTYCDKETGVGIPSTWVPGGNTSELEDYERSQLREKLEALLSVANRFNFEKVKSLAVKALPLVALDPVDTILLARQHEVASWLEPAYLKLCRRSTPLNPMEARQLGLEVTTLIAQARERYRESDEYVEIKRVSKVNGVPFETTAKESEKALSIVARNAIGSAFFPGGYRLQDIALNLLSLN